MTYSRAKECLTELGREKFQELIESLGEEVIDAALELGIDVDTVEEAYQGQYDDDEDFAQRLAEEIGDVSKDIAWPHTCIDWEWAAREIMMDYCAHNGYYFRNL